MKTVIVLLGLLFASPADAETSPAWWQQFYVYVGYRDVDGLDRASGRTLALGYRVELGRWGIDVAALDHTAGRDEGLHQLLRLTGYRTWRNLWMGGGASYALIDGWTDTAIPHRSGHGLVLDAVAGAELASAGFVRAFVQVDVSVPTFGARDRYDSMDTMVRPIGIEVAVGLRF